MPRPVFIADTVAVLIFGAAVSYCYLHDLTAWPAFWTGAGSMWCACVAMAAGKEIMRDRKLRAIAANLEHIGNLARELKASRDVEHLIKALSSWRE